jgi:enamine deaminase RidA (YjgF/YER057c/UK114 family)
VSDARQRVTSSATWESRVGYCRAVRAGHHIYVSGISRWEEFGQAHAEAFAALIDPDMLIEIEADAVLT